jgi:hypothetical protein
MSNNYMGISGHAYDGWMDGTDVDLMDGQADVTDGFNFMKWVANLN